MAQLQEKFGAMSEDQAAEELRLLEATSQDYSADFGSCLASLRDFLLARDLRLQLPAVARLPTLLAALMPPPEAAADADAAGAGAEEDAVLALFRAHAARVSLGDAEATPPVPRWKEQVRMMLSLLLLLLLLLPGCCSCSSCSCCSNCSNCCCCLY